MSEIGLRTAGDSLELDVAQFANSKSGYALLQDGNLVSLQYVRDNGTGTETLIWDGLSGTHRYDVACLGQGSVVSGLRLPQSTLLTDQTVAAKPVEVYLGDSISAGQGASDLLHHFGFLVSHLRGRVAVLRGYPGQGTSIIAGHAGDIPLPGGLSRVNICSGTNDSTLAYDSELPNQVGLLNAVRARIGTSVPITQLAILPSGSDPQIMQAQQDAIAQMTMPANTTFLNANTTPNLFTDKSDPTLFADGLHPTDLGYAKWAQNQLAALSVTAPIPAAPVITSPVAAYGFSGRRFSFGAKH